jgi:hypothetical protein
MISSGVHNEVPTTMSHRRLVRAFIQRRLGIAAPLLALAIVSGAFVLIVDGSIAVGCVVLLLAIPSTWMCGLWIVPNSVDAYAHKMAHLLRDDFAETTREDHQQVERLRDITAAIERLEPPREFMELHVRVLDILQQMDSIKQDDSRELVDRTAQAFRLRQQLLQIREELDGYAAESYIVELADALDNRMVVTTEAADAIQRLLQHQGETLKKLKVPRSWGSQHNAYVQQFTSYLEALERYYGVIKGGSIGEAERAARLFGTQQKKVEELMDEYRVAFHSYHSGRGS